MSRPAARSRAPVRTPAARAAAEVRAHPAAIAAVFVANGLGGPSFLPRLPDRQAALGLSDAGLGLVLVGMAAGALVASPAAGRAVGRVGSRPVAVGAGLLLAAGLWTVGAAPHPVVLFLALAAVGTADAAMDIAMNANGAAYEVRSGRSLLHRLHAAWSLGSLTAAGCAAAAAALDVSLTWHLLAVGVFIAAAVLGARRWLVPDDRLRDAPGGAVGAPTGTGAGSGRTPRPGPMPGVGPTAAGPVARRPGGDSSDPWPPSRPSRSPGPSSRAGRRTGRRCASSAWAPGRGRPRSGSRRSPPACWPADSWATTSPTGTEVRPCSGAAWCSWPWA